MSRAHFITPQCSTYFMENSQKKQKKINIINWQKTLHSLNHMVNWHRHTAQILVNLQFHLSLSECFPLKSMRVRYVLNESKVSSIIELIDEHHETKWMRKNMKTFVRQKLIRCKKKFNKGNGIVVCKYGKFAHFLS